MPRTTLPGAGGGGPGPRGLCRGRAQGLPRRRLPAALGVPARAWASGDPGGARSAPHPLPHSLRDLRRVRPLSGPGFSFLHSWRRSSHSPPPRPLPAAQPRASPSRRSGRASPLSRRGRTAMYLERGSGRVTPWPTRVSSSPIRQRSLIKGALADPSRRIPIEEISLHQNLTSSRN